MKRKPVVAGRRTGLRPAPRPKSGLAWWRGLGRAPKWLLATVTPLALAVAVPGVAPLVADRTRDLFSDEVLTARGESHPELVAGLYWATDAVLSAPASGQVFDEIRQHTNAQLGTSGHQVTLESHRAGRIDIETITAVVEERRLPLRGTAFVADPQGSEEAALVEFRLDSVAGREIPALVPGDAPGGRLYLSDGKIRFVEQGKPEHLVIRAKTERCFCLWRVRIEYSYRGGKRTLVVPPAGQPAFATTAWGPHDVEYNMRTDGAQRYDCLARPASCRFKPTS
ncbi:hypothetical protein Q5425_31715 [Amycolatopsis sp. A133]|uniref:hypothetical protein n=1 Tax=Amycolatopsis sp. A133 TaxID=3064472 RepID=UPI0027FA53ED|nr:hypothetical protein [Amycolatopsis sp. A133]MDQ7808325.1 hypothetical protein [Amycolatopsis sp. A133]